MLSTQPLHDGVFREGEAYKLECLSLAEGSSKSCPDSYCFYTWFAMISKGGRKGVGMSNSYKVCKLRYKKRHGKKHDFAEKQINIH